MCTRVLGEILLVQFTKLACPPFTVSESNMRVPPTHDVDDFLDNVSEVSRLIHGLKAGTISPEYIDTKLEAKSGQQKTASQATPEQRSLRSTKLDQGITVDAENREAARQADLQRKVDELKANRVRKLQARKKYEEYKQGRCQSLAYATDYAKWDLWCPSDEEDDLFNSITPNSPAFKAMEKDITERHSRMVEQRQMAERQRQAGNAAFKAKQYSEALRCYQLGLEPQRHSMALHANAAAAALKLKCYVQTLEHCDKVLHVADVLHNTPSHPLCVKALQRRAAAFQALGQHSKAVADLVQATDMLPGDKEVQEQLTRARTLLQEHCTAKQLKAADATSMDDSTGTQPGSPTAAVAAAAAAASDAASTVATSAAAIAAGTAVDCPFPLHSLQRIKQLVGSMNSSDSESAEGIIGADACKQLLGHVEADARCSIYFGECGGIAATAKHIKKGSGQAKIAAALQLISAACSNSSSNLEQVGQQPQLLVTILDIASSTCSKSSINGDCKPNVATATAMAAAMELLYYTSTTAPLRQQLCKLLLQKACSGSGGSSSSRLQKLWEACLCIQGPRSTAGRPRDSSPDAVAKVHALSLLSNCMLLTSVRDAAHQMLQQQPQQLQHLASIVQHLMPFPASTSSSSTTAAKLLEKVLCLLSNISTHASIRQQLAMHQDLLSQLMAVAALPDDTAATGGSCTQSSSSGVQAAALGCLCNLSLEPGVQLACGSNIGLLLSLATAAAFMSSGSNVSSSNSPFMGAHAAKTPAVQGPNLPARTQQQQDHQRVVAVATAAESSAGEGAVPQQQLQQQQLLAAQRAAVVLSRAAKQPQSLLQLQQLNATGKLLDTLAAVLNKMQQQQHCGLGPVAEANPHKQQHQQQQHSVQPEKQDDEYALLASWLDAAVRTVATLTAQQGACSSSSAVGRTAISICLALLRSSNASASRSSTSSDLPHAAEQKHTSTAAAAGAALRLSAGVQGNAALVLSHFAAEKCWHSLLHDLDAVDVLVRMAIVHGKGSVVTRNAGIALARMAANSAMMERLRELHGVEIVYQYVRP